MDIKRFLCLDTSAGCAAALVDYQPEKGANVLAEIYSADSRSHAENLAGMLTQVVKNAGFNNLAAAGVDYLVVGRGPAPFTGLRAGLVAARTLGAALNIPTLGVCSLAVLARAAFDHGANGELLVTADARRKELYAAAYRAEGVDSVAELSAPEVAKAAHFAQLAQERHWQVVGVGQQLYPEALGECSGLALQISAPVMARLAGAELAKKDNEVVPEALQDLSPLYLRRPDVHPGGIKK